jgi:hypothetical protein
VNRPRPHSARARTRFRINVQLPLFNTSATVVNAELKIRVRDAPALAGAAVVTGLPAVDRRGDVGRPADRDGAPKLLLHTRPHLHLAA